jgi:hypothetical protein
MVSASFDALVDPDDLRTRGLPIATPPAEHIGENPFKNSADGAQ